MNQNLHDAIDTYRVPDSAVEILNNTKIAFIVGVSGAGKNTVLHKLLGTDKYHLIVSHTTRSPRANHGVQEQNGVEYFFINEDKALQMLKNNEFIEAKHYSGNLYGTSVSEIKKAHDEGKIAISDIEVQGVAEYKNVADNVIPIFLLPPDFETWQSRLKFRYGDQPANPEDIKKRMQTAKQELQEALDKDYFEFIVNDDLDRTVQIADEIAHGHLSTRKNQKARELAQELLQKL